MPTYRASAAALFAATALGSLLAVLYILSSTYDVPAGLSVKMAHPFGILGMRNKTRQGMDLGTIEKTTVYEDRYGEMVPEWIPEEGRAGPGAMRQSELIDTPLELLELEKAVLTSLAEGVSAKVTSELSDEMRLPPGLTLPPAAQVRKTPEVGQV